MGKAGSVLAVARVNDSVLEELAKTLLCIRCGCSPRLADGRVSCDCDSSPFVRTAENLLLYDREHVPPSKSEMEARDRQAEGYLKHGKFPIQLYRIDEFIRAARRRLTAHPVLDLGCGPGPTTERLLRAGFQVVAVDFSGGSLRLNRDACRFASDRALFVQADLSHVRFRPASSGGLVMADFLQHLDGSTAQSEFLHKAFEALVSGGWFFLSVFNANVKNRLKNDIDGAYSGGAIPYHRFTREEVLKLLPPGARVERVFPMNIFHAALPDRIAARLPFARHLGRMMVFCGSKT